MKVLYKLLAVTIAAMLAACQPIAPTQRPDPVDPVPPTVSSQGTSAATPPRAVAAAGSQQQSTTVITLHLAQQQQEDELIEVDAGGTAPLYALPQPVLTQADMGRVSPVTTQDGRSFVLLEMNQHGIPKLQSVTQQARGHYLLLSVQGQLVSVAQIGGTISDGRLLVSTQGPEHKQAIIRMMQGGQ